MTPGARVAAAIEILDHITAGQPAEQALLRWSRASRFAGSKDRAAVRDYVFDALRHWRSDAAFGQGTTGRARMIGRLFQAGVSPHSLFTGEGHAPPALTEAEAIPGTPPSDMDAFDVPDWIWPDLVEAKGLDGAKAIAAAWQDRAPVTLRVNQARTTPAAVLSILGEAGCVARMNNRAPWAITVTEGARRLRQHPLYHDGLIEFQDASSQAVVAALPEVGTTLDYCAGGGGKALALAARGCAVSAHDIDPRRMADLPDRAARAGAQIEICTPEDLAKADMVEVDRFDLVLCDAPCSGSGAWRRSPEGKWSLTPERLSALVKRQAEVLDQAMHYVAPNGVLAYATCSVLDAENDESAQAFLDRHPDWRLVDRKTWPVDADGDGFFLAIFRKG